MGTMCFERLVAACSRQSDLGPATVAVVVERLLGWRSGEAGGE